MCDKTNCNYAYSGNPCCDQYEPSNCIEQAVNDVWSVKQGQINGLVEQAETAAENSEASAKASAESAAESKEFRDEAELAATTATDAMGTVISVVNNLQDVADELNTAVAGIAVATWYYTAISDNQTVIPVPADKNEVDIQAIYINGERKEPNRGFIFDKLARTITLAEGIPLGLEIAIIMGTYSDNPNDFAHTLASNNGASLVGTSNGLTVQQELNNNLLNDREQWRRSLAEAGLTLVAGSFEEGVTVNNKMDAVWHIAGGQCYTWDAAGTKTIPANSTPDNSGGIGSGAWLSVGDVALRQRVMQASVQLEDFGAVGDGVTDDTAAFVAANSALIDDSFISLIPGRNYKISGFTFTKRISIGCSGGRAKITSETGLSWLTVSTDLDITIANIDMIPTLAPDQNNPTNAIRIEVTNKNFGSGGRARIKDVNIDRPGTLAFYNGISVKNQPVIIEGGDIVLLQSHTNNAAKDGSLANWAVNSGAGVLLDGATYSVVRNTRVYYATDGIKATGTIEEVHLISCGTFNNRRCYVFEGLTGSANEHRIWGCHGTTYLEGININPDGATYLSLCSVDNSSILAVNDATAPQIVYLSGWLDSANINSFQAFNNGTRGANDIAIWLRTVNGIGSRRVMVNNLQMRGVGTGVYIDNNQRHFISGVSPLQVNMVGPSPVIYAYGPNATAPVSIAYGFSEQENVFPAGLMATRLMATGWLGIKDPNTVTDYGSELFRIRGVSGNYQIETADSAGVLQANARFDQGGSFRTKGVYPLTTNIYTNGHPSFVWAGGYTQVAFTITSDMREKTSITALSDESALLDAWGDVEWYRFKLVDHVNRFGDAAEYQMGVMAQEILSIFQTHGLDASEYGIVSYASWDESMDDESGEVTPAGDLYTVNYEAANALEAVYQRRNYERLLANQEAMVARIEKLESLISKAN